MRQVEELRQPLLVLLGPGDHGDEIIGASDGGAEGDGDDVDEGVGDGFASRVGERGEVIGDARRGGGIGGHGFRIPVVSDAPQVGSPAEKPGHQTGNHFKLSIVTRSPWLRPVWTGSGLDDGPRLV